MEESTRRKIRVLSTTMSLIVSNGRINSKEDKNEHHEIRCEGSRECTGDHGDREDTGIETTH